MPSLITTDIIRYQHSTSGRSVRSHVLHPHSDITIVCIIGSAKENVTSVVEDHLLETISSTEWRYGEEDADFSYVTEKYNRFLSNLSTADEETVNIVFAIERDAHLMVSSIGESEVILQEKDAPATSIHEDTRGHHRFELISSGDIPLSGSVFISSKNLEGIVGESFYEDCASQESTIFANMTVEVLKREVGETLHMIRIRRSETQVRGTISRLHNKKISFVQEKCKEYKEAFLRNQKWRNFKEYVRASLEKRQNILTLIFLLVGVVIFFGLVSYLINSLFSVTSGQTKDAKNQIIQAQNLLESSKKLTSNPPAFDATIKDTEKILSDLESKQLYVKDVQDIRDKIEAMKKEIYDIQVVELSGRPSIVPIDIKSQSPLGIYEREKKLYIVNKENIIWDYAKGDALPKIKPYPSGESVRGFTVVDDGNVYMLTDSDRIIASRKNADISYVNVSGQESWEKSDGIDTFNGNLYLWNKAEGQIYRHKPGLNGFSQQSPVLASPMPGIVDIGIDGGFYIIKDDQKITRVISSTKTQTGIIINKIPGEYTIGNKQNDTKIIVGAGLNHIYILDGDRVWIFLPDSKRFQDIRSWTYIAQIELSTQEDIRDISVTRDGLIYVLTDKGVYDIFFEFADNNIILRS